MQYPTILESVFRHFSEGNEEMNFDQYLKLAVACHFIDRKFTKSELSHIFAKSVSQEARAINFHKFKENFNLFATTKGIGKNDVVRAIEAYGRSTFFPDPYAFVKTRETYSSPSKSYTGIGSSSAPTISTLSVL